MKTSKKLSFLILMTLASSFCFAQKSPVKGFMKEMKKKDREHVFKIGMGRLPIIVAKWFVDEDLKPLAKHVRKLRLLNVDSSEQITSGDWKKLEGQLSEAGYEEMLAFSDGGNDVSLRMQSTDDKVKYVTAIMDEADGKMLLELKTKLTFAEIEKLVTDYSE